MRPIRLMAAAGLLMATAALAQDDFYQAALDLLEARLAKVQPAKTYFYSGEEKAGCPAMTPACRRAVYLRAGDVVLIGEARGAFVFASFTAGGARMTGGWLPRAAVVPLPAPVQPPAAWRGEWARDDEASITIRPGKRPGSLSFSGDAIYGSHDPDRVRRGAVNIGQWTKESVPKGDRVNVENTDPFDDCKVRMRLIGPYLAVADNGACGGFNVSFSGVYRRAAGRKLA